MNRQPKYTYARASAGWVVYKMTYFENGSIGQKVTQYPTIEEARAEVYRLNRWQIQNNKPELKQSSMTKNHYDILKLSAMTREHLEKVAKEARVDTLNKNRQAIMYEILEAQSKEPAKV